MVSTRLAVGEFVDASAHLNQLVTVACSFIHGMSTLSYHLLLPIVSLSDSRIVSQGVVATRGCRILGGQTRRQQAGVV